MSDEHQHKAYEHAAEADKILKKDPPSNMSAVNVPAFYQHLDEHASATALVSIAFSLDRIAWALEKANDIAEGKTL